MSYLEHAPPPGLAPWLECLWERHDESSPAVRVLPDGCIDIVFTEGLGAQVVGANTTAFVVPVEGAIHAAGARMLPGCAPALLEVAAEELRDARIAVADVLARGARLEEWLAASADPIATLQRDLLACATRAPRPDPLVREAIARLERSSIAIAELADDLGVSERGLRRRVTAAVGYGPRRLARVFRLRQALQAARAGDELARAAYAAGYADQAHFTHDCRELAGVPPSVLLVADSYKTPRRRSASMTA
jgi:AraC-like DNA-binding protein